MGLNVYGSAGKKFISSSVTQEPNDVMLTPSGVLLQDLTRTVSQLSP